MAQKRGRGRPQTFSPATRKRLAALVEQHGARRAAEVTSISISVGTLLTIAGEFGVQLKKGRRPKKAA